MAHLRKGEETINLIHDDHKEKKEYQDDCLAMSFKEANVTEKSIMWNYAVRHQSKYNDARAAILDMETK